jgi:hypothetical protein
VAAEEEGGEPEEVQHEGDHEVRLWLAGSDESTTCGTDEV